MSASSRNGLAFRVDSALMATFAAFSGDRSPLHMDPEHGMRSRYGGNVVHGMLPLMALPVLIHDRLPEGRFRVRRVQARFMHPVLPGDVLRAVGALENDGEGLKLTFEIQHGASGAVVTRGTLSLENMVTEAHARSTKTQAAPLCPLREVADHRFEEVGMGMHSELEFTWGDAQGAALQDLLHQLHADLQEDLVDRALDHVDLLPFVTMALLSTQVGMVMPGRTATFQEFTLEFEAHGALANGQGRLASTVSGLSSATRTLTQDVVIRLGDTQLAHGKLMAQVARAPFVPPSMAELALTAADLGLRDKVVLITGASRGLGATTAKLFALHGARVVVNYRSAKDQAEAVVADIMHSGGQAVAIQADVRDATALKAMVEQVAARWGDVDVLVNNAAGNFHPIPFEGTAWEKVQEDLDVILKGAFLAAQAVLPGFLAKGAGRIINVSTVAVETPPRLQSKYVIAKSALNGLTRALAVEFADRNILVNMVVPSFVETDFTGSFNRVALGQLKAASPLKRLAEPREVAEAIVFLASARSSFTTGQKLMVTGGLPPYL